MNRFEPDDRWILKLNRYQRDNLLWLINACGMGGAQNSVPPFTLANTGDWIGEIYWLLDGNSPEAISPNHTVEELRQQVKAWLEEARGSEDALPDAEPEGVTMEMKGKTLTFTSAEAGALGQWLRGQAAGRAIRNEYIDEQLVRRLGECLAQGYTITVAAAAAPEASHGNPAE